MKYLLSIFSLCFFLLLPVVSLAQDDKDWPPLDYLKSDYRQASVVAHVLEQKAEIVSKVVGYEEWRVSCKVIETFKGKIRKGDEIEYYLVAEAGLEEKWFLGERIVFLLRSYNEKQKKWLYASIENSTLKHTGEIVKKLRQIKRSVQPKVKSRPKAKHKKVRQQKVTR